MEERNLTSKEYKELVLSGMSTLSEKQTVGLCGRIIRGKEPKDFELLSDEPGKKLSWLVGHDGLHGLSGKQGWSMLRELGKDKEWVAKKLKDGYKFKLVVFPSVVDCHLADWNGIFQLLPHAYPDAWPTIEKYKHELTTMEFQHIQEEFYKHPRGFNMRQIELSGRSHPMYTTYERFIRDKCDSLGEVRAFLYHEVGLSHLFSGKGITVSEDGKIGWKEYLTHNRPLKEIEGLEMIDIHVQLEELVE